MEKEKWINASTKSGLFSKEVFARGMRDGIPIGLGYFAVSFSLGIAARKAGLTPFQGFLQSILNNASAGQYAALMSISAQASYLELAIVTLVANARYMLMSCALSQRLSPDTPFYHRLLLGYDVADELFGITIAQAGYINPFYTYGAILMAAPCWAVGTAIGITAGNLLPTSIVNALSVALYGMFLAVIVPPMRQSKVIRGLVVISFLASFAVQQLHIFSSGTQTIVLTIILSLAAAVLFPIDQEEGYHEV
ncbi:branched-chain amino acid ABC transporter permease [Enterococcus florum]|uniref:Branched-chain amino acid ABC transporter permease n=1 Tax=Enterococcus florum TaxID=2480627 RepID=A0A4P5P9P8_9ENTE|nr:AzlC family ABC transporter permease [Enterococcus florum]GCF94807.1 branched-chain amino acid ABC transporter permease [Enterococcus florum]